MLWALGGVRHTTLAQAHCLLAGAHYKRRRNLLSNFQFFLTHSIGSSQQYPLLRKTEAVIATTGYMCTPCKGLAIYNEQHRYKTRPRDLLRATPVICIVNNAMTKGSHPLATRCVAKSPGRRLLAFCEEGTTGAAALTQQPDLPVTAQVTHSCKLYLSRSKEM